MKFQDMAELAQTLFEEIGDALFITSPVPVRVINVNPMAERLTRRSKAELLQVAVEELFQSEEDEELEQLKRALHTTQTFHSQEGYFLRQGTGEHWIPVNLTLTRLHTEAGRMGLILARDISERRQVEEKLRLANSTLEQTVRERTSDLAKANHSLVEALTLQEQATTALRESEELFRSAFEHTGVAMVLTDLDNRFLRVNGAFAQLFGYSMNEMVGMTMAQITHPTFLEESYSRREALLRGDASFFQMEKRYLHKSGQDFWGLTNVSLVRSREGRPVQYVGQVQNITFAKRSLETTERYNERLKILHQIDRALIAGEQPQEIAATTLPLLRDLLGVRRVVVNLFDLDNNQVEWLAAVGRRRIHLGPSVRYPMQFMGDLEALRRGEVQWIEVQDLPAGQEVEALRASGVHSYMVVPMISRDELIGAVSFGGSEEPISAEQISIAQEVATQFAITLTQARLHSQVKKYAQELENRVRERTEELQKAHESVTKFNSELKAANAELESFSYSVSHDLRAPLRAIDGFSRILIENHAAHLPEDARDYLQEVRDCAREMGQLVDDLLAFSRLGRQMMRDQVISHRRIVEDCLEDLQGEFADRQINLSLQELLPSKGDPILLKQVWINLLSNALKYTSKVPVANIEIASQVSNESADEITFWIKDNGVGFDMRYAHKLFGVFQRLHRAEEYPGTGVGLAIVQRIVHRHGGRVWAESRRGEGSTFYFTLKRAVDD